ncbi:diguanylate cyclase domain-containing protein [Cellulomonas soli]|uniref:diguanylate cyclase domain-containing protein n=1 Tax=Cellulomonas soli TaxID=931535 RepID=UPI003F86BF72
MGTTAGRTGPATAVAVGTLLLALALGALHQAGAPTAAMLLAQAVATGVVAVRLARRRLGARGGWWFVLVGLLILDLDTVVRTAHGAANPTPEWWLAVSPLGLLAALLGIVALLVGPRRRYDTSVVESAIFAVTTTALLWGVVARPHLVAIGASPAAQLHAAASVFLSSAIAGAGFRVAVARPGGRGALRYIVVALTINLVAQASRVVTWESDLDRAPWVGLLWIGVYLTIGAAAADPDAEHLVGLHRPRTARLTGLRVVALACALALNPLVVSVQQLAGAEPDASALLVGTLLITPLVAVMLHQVSRAQRDTEARMAHQAVHDPLTGLPNRRHVDQLTGELVERVASGESPGAVVLFVDLDDFKEVNDTYGHGVGDDLLVVVARRLTEAVHDVSDQGVVARFGGDEFLVLLEGPVDGLAERAAAAIDLRLAAPIDLGPLVTSTRASIGSAQVRSGEVRSASSLLSGADAAMYAQKRRRRRRPARVLGAVARASGAARDQVPG